MIVSSGFGHDPGAGVDGLLGRVAEWQTRTVQVRVSVRTWGFNSPLAHHSGDDRTRPSAIVTSRSCGQTATGVRKNLPANGPAGRSHNGGAPAHVTPKPLDVPPGGSRHRRSHSGGADTRYRRYAGHLVSGLAPADLRQQLRQCDDVDLVVERLRRWLHPHVPAGDGRD